MTGASLKHILYIGNFSIPKGRPSLNTPPGNLEDIPVTQPCAVMI